MELLLGLTLLAGLMTGAAHRLGATEDSEMARYQRECFEKALIVKQLEDKLQKQLKFSQTL